jgi:hypothetical protein
MGSTHSGMKKEMNCSTEVSTSGHFKNVDKFHQGKEPELHLFFTQGPTTV